MTDVQFGLDVSSNQTGLSVAQVKRQGFTFLTARALSFPDGQMRPDPAYAGFRDQAKSLDLAFSAYVLFHTYYTPEAQAKALKDAIGDLSIPVMLDWEKDGNSSVPDYQFIVNCYDACHAEGLNPQSLYAPRWYWKNQGSPRLMNRPWRLINSMYVPGYDYASKLYPGTNFQGWQTYGGLPVSILQFTDNVKIDGYPKGVDANAFLGTLLDLTHPTTGLFKDWRPSPMSQVSPTLAEIQLAVRAELNRGTAQGQVDWAGTSAAGLGDTQADINLDRQETSILVQLENDIQTMKEQLTAIQEQLKTPPAS